MTHQEAKAREYLRTQIQTASREQLVLMLYDGAIRFCEQARQMLTQEDIEGGHRFFLRAQNVVLELLYALDRESGGEVAANLAALYTYMYNQLVEANVYKDVERVEHVLSILRSLRDAWSDAITQIRSGAAKGGETAAGAAPSRGMAV
jgi:flagellar protein FliS